MQLIEQEAKELSLSLPRKISSLKPTEFTMEMDGFLDRCTKNIMKKEWPKSVCI